jgi:hypothetical protein
MMDWNDGSSYGYDAVYANTQLDNYDAPYTTVAGDLPHRTMKSAQMPSREPVASYYGTARRPYHSPDSSLLGPENPEVRASSSHHHIVGDDMTIVHPCGCGCGHGIPGPVGQMLDCGCGCRGAAKVSKLREVKDKLLSGDVDLNNVYMFFIFMLAVILIVNSMNMKHLKDQVKMLTKAATQRGPAQGPAT